MGNFTLTVHMIIKNEERFIKAAILSVLDYADRMLIWDTGSSDKTVEIIKAIQSKKIEFKNFRKIDRKRLVFLRNEQIKLTETPWFMLLDGDEIWPKKNILKMIKAAKVAKPATIALVNRTRNCLGDIYHYLPEDKGRYKIGNWQGHLNIRFIKNIKGLRVSGLYPLESYQLGNLRVQDLIDRLEFVDTWYLHATHLKRSGWRHQFEVIDRVKKYKFWGHKLEMKLDEIPEVFKIDDINFSGLKVRSFLQAYRSRPKIRK